MRCPHRLPFAAAAVLAVGLAVLLPGCTGRTPYEAPDWPEITYPTSRTVDQVDDYHGTQVADPYRWLEDVDSEETRAWIEAQNELTFGILGSIPARERLRARLTELMDYTRYSNPFEEGGRIFFSQNDGLQPHSVLYVQDGPDAEPRVLLDPNTFSEDGTVSLGGVSVSDDGKLVAWAKSVSGSDWRTWYVRDIDSGRDLDDVIEWSKFSGASWAKDGKGFYYSRYDAPAAEDAYEETNYFQKLYYHEVGTPQSRDVLVYERPDQKEWGFGGDVSEDGRYLVISVWQGTDKNNRLFYQELSDPGNEIVELLSELEASYTFIGNDGPVFYLLTDLGAPRGKVVAVDIRNPAKDTWRDVIPQAEDVLQGATILDDMIVAEYLHDVTSQVKIHDLSGMFVREIALPGLGTAYGFRGHRDDTETYYTFTSFLNPSQIFRLDLRTGRSTLFREPEIDFDFTAYETEQIFYNSKDGTRVPMFIVHRKGLARDGMNPTHLYGYGGFNISMKPYFSTDLLPWLEMGGVFALANLRGGGEYGEDWHQQGMLENKQNVFDDFIAAAEFLIAEGWTSTPRLAISGGSNGGLLVGACLNQRPDLFGAAIPAVGVMDMLRFHRFTIGWAWVSDYGSSEDPAMFPTLYAYSPYHNIRDGARYPTVMITTADHDDRVVPGHSFKYAARLQQAQAGDAPILIRIQTKSGHGGGKPTAMIIEEQADEYAFLMKALGMED